MSPFALYVWAATFFFLSVLISSLDENRKTYESLLFILIFVFGLFKKATQTTEANFSHLTSTSHRNEMEMTVRSTRRNSSPIYLRNLTTKIASKTLRVVNPHGDEYRCR